jgi:hypothetical protein
MKYWLHPEAAEDLREASEFYRERAGNNLSQSFLAEFERSVTMLLELRVWAPCGGTAIVGI